MALKSDGFLNSSQLEDRRGDKPLHLAAARGDYAVILPEFIADVRCSVRKARSTVPKFITFISFMGGIVTINLYG